jgi:hypothetical protein
MTTYTTTANEREGQVMTSELTRLREVNAELRDLLIKAAHDLEYLGALNTARMLRAAMYRAIALTPAQLEAVQQDIDMGR